MSLIRTAGLSLGMALLASATVASPTSLFTPSRTVESPDHEGGYTFSIATTIGGEDADDDASFYEKLGSVLVGADGSGNLYVLDSGNARVQVFDADGSFVRSIGQEGQGPGELQLPARMSVNASGQVAVFDLGLQRLSIFEASGKLVRDQIVEGMVSEIALLDDGSIIVAHEDSRPAVCQRFDPAGNSVWRFGEAPPEEEMEMMRMKISSGTNAANLAVVGERLLHASDGPYCVLAVSTSGEQLDSFARSFERQKFELPQPSDDEDGEGGGMVFISVTEEDDGSGPKRDVSVGGGEEHAMTFDRRQLEDMMPKFSADVRGILAWPDGRAWVVTSEQDDDHMTADEWGADGTYLRAFTIPAEYDKLAVGADGALYAVTHDEDDFPMVHRLTVNQK